MNAPLTGQDLLALEWEFVMHMTLARGAYRVTYRCLDYPDLTVTKSKERGHPLEQLIFLGEEELTWGDWDAVAARLNALPVQERAA